MSEEATVYPIANELKGETATAPVGPKDKKDKEIGIEAQCNNRKNTKKAPTVIMTRIVTSVLRG